MHVLVATAGALAAEPVVRFARHLMGGTGSVTVATVVEVPRSFLEEVHGDDWHPLHDEGHRTPAEQTVEDYLNERGHRITDPLRQALTAARIPCDVRILEGADAATAISEAADDLSADIVIIGATKQIFDRDAWESVSARVMIESGRPVLVVPESQKPQDDDRHLAFNAAPPSSTED